MSCCGKAPTLLFPCSGAADVGELADRSARAATLEGIGRMYCLAAMGARLPAFIEQAREADAIVAIDGCPEQCASRCLEGAGVPATFVIRLRELGFEKGKTRRTGHAVAKVVETIKSTICHSQEGSVP